MEDLWVPAVGLLPAVFGVLLPLGHNGARWIALIWMACELATSLFDSLDNVGAHALLLALMPMLSFALTREPTFTVGATRARSRPVPDAHATASLAQAVRLASMVGGQPTSFTCSRSACIGWALAAVRSIPKTIQTG